MRRAYPAIAALALCGVLAVHSAQAADVSITASASLVPRGGTAGITVDVQPPTFVQSITITYEGETAQDTCAAAPCSVSHVFPIAMDDLTITAVVQFNNGDPAQQATTDIDVVGLRLRGPATPNRASLGSYVADSEPAGKLLTQFSWSYQATTPSFTNTFQDPDTDGDGRSIWYGTMVSPGTMSCTAVFNGVQVAQSFQVIPRARPWVTPISCLQDNEAAWGDVPDDKAELGKNRDKESNAPDYYFVPRTGAASWNESRTLAQVPYGPCAGVWYVSSTTLKCERETVINKYIKANAPEVGGTTFQAQNTYLGCLYPSPAEFVTAIGRHEYCGPEGSGPSLWGHHGRTVMFMQGTGGDPRAAIEPLMHLDKTALGVDINTALVAIENELRGMAQDEFAMSTAMPNWGQDPTYSTSLGLGLYSGWDGWSWTACQNGRLGF